MDVGRRTDRELGQEFGHQLGIAPAVPDEGGDVAKHLASMPTLVLDQAVAHGGERGLGVLKQGLSALGLHKRVGREHQGMPVENGFDGLEPIVGQA